MAKERNYIEEILSIQSRTNRDSLYLHFISRLEALDRLFSQSSLVDEEVIKYFPIGLVACLEGYFRIVIKELINFGEPFISNVSKLKKIQIDFIYLKAINQKTITLGDLIAHLLKINNLSDINSYMSILINRKFLKELVTVYDRAEVEIHGKEKINIIEDPSVVFTGINKTFEYRHIFAHEIADGYTIDKEIIASCLQSVKIFIKATSEYITELMYPNAPLTQLEITQYVGNRFDLAKKELEKLILELKSDLIDEDLDKFIKAQALWEESMKADTEFIADIGGKGGTIWSSLYSMEAESLVQRRIDYLKSIEQSIKY